MESVLEVVKHKAMSQSRAQRRRTFVESVVPVAALLALVIYFSATTQSFLTKANFLVLTETIGPLLLVSLGATFVVITGSIDLSVGSVAMLSGSVTAVLLANTGAGLWVLPIAVAVGALCGLISGVIFSYGRVPSFIVTLGALSVFQGIGLLLINGSPVPFDNVAFSNLAIGQLVPSVGNVALWGIGLWAVSVFVCLRTKFGHYMYAIGGSERVARLSGVAVDRYKVYPFIWSGMTSAIAGLLSVAQLSSGGPTLGTGFLLDSLAAIVVGGTALTGGVGGVHRTLLGVLIISILDDGLNMRGVGEFSQEVIKGAVIIVAAAVVMIGQRKGIVK